MGGVGPRGPAAVRKLMRWHGGTSRVCPDRQLADLLIERYRMPTPKAATESEYEGWKYVTPARAGRGAIPVRPRPPALSRASTHVPVPWGVVGLTGPPSKHRLRTPRVGTCALCSAAVRRPVQIRVLNVIKQWLDKYKDDFFDVPQLCDKLLPFLTDPEVVKLTSVQVVNKLQTELQRIVSRRGPARRGLVRARQACALQEANAAGAVDLPCGGGGVTQRDNPDSRPPAAGMVLRAGSATRAPPKPLELGTGADDLPISVLKVRVATPKIGVDECGDVEQQRRGCVAPRR